MPVTARVAGPVTYKSMFAVGTGRSFLVGDCLSAVGAEFGARKELMAALTAGERFL